MRACGHAATANVADDLALFNLFARPNATTVFIEVSVQSAVFLAVLNDNNPPIAPFVSSPNYFAVSCRFYWCAS